MSLSFLPNNVKQALSNLNENYISEIRIRRGQPVIIEYKGEYKYINSLGITDSDRGLITVDAIEPIISSATEGSLYAYVEQMKSGFITVQNGVRIGIAGEYVTCGDCVQSIKNITSLNIRIPHNVIGCADLVYKNIFFNSLHSTLLFSKPGFGKTTMLRDLAIQLCNTRKYNILIFDERNEISAIDGEGNGYNLGDRVDIIRCHNKKSAIPSAIRAMKPQIIITDELYGADDIKAVEYAVNCGIYVIASSHVCNREILKIMPFEFYVELTGVGVKPLLYDKNFNSYSCCNSDDNAGDISFCKQEKENAGFCRTLRI